MTFDGDGVGAGTGTGGLGVCGDVDDGIGSDVSVHEPHIFSGTGAKIASAVRDEANHVGVHVRVVEKLLTAHGAPVVHPRNGVKIASAVHSEAVQVSVYVHVVQDAFASPSIRLLLLAAHVGTARHPRNGPRIASAVRDEADHVGVHHSWRRCGAPWRQLTPSVLSSACSPDVMTLTRVPFFASPGGPNRAARAPSRNI